MKVMIQSFREVSLIKSNSKQWKHWLVKNSKKWHW